MNAPNDNTVTSWLSPKAIRNVGAPVVFCAALFWLVYILLVQNQEANASKLTEAVNLATQANDKGTEILKQHTDMLKTKEEDQKLLKGICYGVHSDPAARLKFCEP